MARCELGASRVKESRPLFPHADRRRGTAEALSLNPCRNLLALLPRRKSGTGLSNGLPDRAVCR